MKTLIYIGNKFGVRKHTNLTLIDTLEPLLIEEGFKVYSASSKKNIFARLMQMLWFCLKYRTHADYVLIDTYSTLNFYYAYFVSQFCRILKLKYLPIIHGGDIPNRLKKSPWLSKTIFNNAYVNIAPSLYTKSNFEGLGFHKMLCIPNAIELKNYPLKERSFDSIKLLWVRSFSKMYNPLLAIKILKAFKDENIMAELCMVGPDSDGSLQEAKNYAKQVGVDVEFTGKLSKQEWVRLSQDFNIFINTTNIDNMPLSVIEAMALGLPVVSTHVGGMPFLIENNKNGMLVEPDSAEAFVDSIKHIISSPENTKLIIQEARQRVENLDWEIVKKQWINVLE